MIKPQEDRSVSERADVKVEDYGKLFADTLVRLSRQFQTLGKNCPEVIEDAVSSALLKFIEGGYEHRKSFDDYSKLKYYLFVMAHNNLLAYLQRSKTIEYWEHEALCKVLDLNDEIEAGDPQFLAYAQQCIENLKPIYRDVAKPRLGGQTFQSIADQLEIKERTARKRFDKVREILQKDFQEYKDSRD